MARSRVEGADKLTRMLRRMPDTATEGLRRGIREEANLLNMEFISAAPAKSVANALQVKFASDGLSARVGLIDKRNRRKGFLGFIFESGASSHIIKAGASRRRGRARRVLRTAEGEFLGPSVSHPGMSARPWFSSVIAAFGSQIVERIREQVVRAIGELIAGIR